MVGQMSNLGAIHAFSKYKLNVFNFNIKECFNWELNIYGILYILRISMMICDWLCVNRRMEPSQLSISEFIEEENGDEQSYLLKKYYERNEYRCSTMLYYYVNPQSILY